MRSTLLLSLLALVTGGFVAGCAGMPIPGLGGTAGGCEPSLFIRQGITSQEEISSRCGAPTRRSSNASGSTWTYDPDVGVSTGDVMSDSCAGMTGVAYNLCVANLPKKLYMTVQFDTRGIVTDYDARQELRQAAPPGSR